MHTKAMGALVTTIFILFIAGLGVHTAQAQNTKDELQAKAQHTALQLVLTWERAQNEGDFAAYALLYGRKMRGTKRVGARESVFRRKGWLRDRKRMFQKPMKVQVRRIRAFVRDGMIRAWFEQTFESGTFLDKGEKTLLLRVEDGKWVIHREEFSPSIEGAGTPKPNPQFIGVLFHAPATPGFIVGKGDPKWGKGHLSPSQVEVGEIGYGGLVVMTRKLRLSSLPKQKRSLIGKPIYVLTKDGVCTDTIASLLLVGGFYPNEGAPGIGGMKDKEIFRMDTKLSVIPSGECKGRIAWLDDRFRSPRRLSPLQDSAKAEEVLATFRKSRPYRFRQEKFRREEKGAKGTWATNTEVRLFQGESEVYAVVSGDRNEGCADFYASLTGIFVLKAGKWRSRSFLNEWLIAEEIVFLNNDAFPEVFGWLNATLPGTALLRGHAKGPTYVGVHEWATQGCYC